MGPCPRRTACQKGPWAAQGPEVTVFSMRMIRLQQRKQVDQKQKSNVLLTSLIRATFRARHICQVRRSHLLPCVYFPVYKYWFGLDPCFGIGIQGALLSPFWGSQWLRSSVGGPPGPHLNLHHICRLYYLEHLELPLKLLFEERIPLD